MVNKITHKLFILGLVALAGVSCVREQYDDGECAEEVRVRVIPEWIGTESQTEQGTTNIQIYTSAGGNLVENLVTNQEGSDLEIVPGTYQFLGFENATNATVNKSTVSVALEPDGHAGQPTMFAAGSVTAEVLNQRVSQTIPVPMRAQVRELIIQLRYEGEGAPFVVSARGSVDGIALSRDINNGFPPVSGTERPAALTNGILDYTFTEGPDDWFTGSRNAIGIDGSVGQELTLSVTFSIDDYTATDTIDITGEMTGFHTEELPGPWYVILDINVGATFEMSIIDWQGGGTSILDAQ